MYFAKEDRYEKMKYAYCGNSGLKLPLVSLGLWHNFGDHSNLESMKDILFTAFDNGITHFDLANNYGPAPGSAEKNFGIILKEDFGKYRDEMIISTKAGYTMWDGPYGDFGSRKYLIASIDQSLKRMGLEYVDIFYHHRMDKNTPLEETCGALAQIVNSGKALYVGISNYDGETLEQAAKILDELKVPFIINQNRYSIFDRTIENNGLNFSNSDFTLSFFTRFLNENNLTEKKMEAIRKLNDIAKERNQSLAQMALSWVLKDDVITSVLIGASKPSQVLDNIASVENTSFSEEELKKIDEIVKAYE